MSLKKAYRLIPSSRRRRLPLIILSALCSAVVDLVGIAALVSVLVLVLDTRVAAGNRYFSALFSFFGLHSEAQLVTLVCVAVLVVIALKGLLGVSLMQVRNRYMMELYADLSKRMYRNYLSRGLLFVRQNHTATLVNNVNAVCNRFAQGVISPLSVILTELIVLVVMLVLLALYNPLMVLLAVAVFAPMALIYSKVIRRRMAENGRNENRMQVAQNKTMYEALRGYADIEIGNAKSFVAERFESGIEKLRGYALKNLLIHSVAGYLVEFALVAGVVAVIIIGMAVGKPMGELRIFLGIFAIAAYRIVPSVNRIIGSWAEYRRNEYVVDLLTEQLAVDTVEEVSSSERLPFEREIRLDDISFAYSDSPDVLTDFSLTVRKGEKIGFQGTSGRGKTTLFNIIAALFEPSSGQLSVDDTRVDSPLKKRMWQNEIAYVSQDLFIPDISIAENIAFGIEAGSIDHDRVRFAIRAARLDSLVDSLPDGAATVTGEAGCRLSGGQRQRIGIARALYKNASVLMFDEATSSLDETTESEIVGFLEQLSAADNRLTILIISHNDKTLAFCDRIIRI